MPGSNDSKQMCLTVCLGSPGLKFCLLHSNCFLNFLSVSPPLVPPSLKGVPGRAWVCQAGPGLTGYSDPAGAILVCVYLQDACCSSGCFSHHKCRLGRGPVWKPWWKSFQSSILGNSAAPECQAEPAGSLLPRRVPALGGRASKTALCSVWASAGALFVEQAWRDHSGPGRHLWAWLAFLFSAMCPPHPLLSRNSRLCQAGGNYS